MHQSMASVLSVAMSIVAICVFDGYIRDVIHLYNDTYVHRLMFGHVILEKHVEGEIFGSPLEPDLISSDETKKLMSLLKEEDHDIAAISPTLQVAGRLQVGTSEAAFLGLAVDVPSALEFRNPRWRWDVIAGEPLHRASENAVLLGSDLAKVAGCTTPAFAENLSGVLGYPERNQSFQCASDTAIATGVTENGRASLSMLKIAGITSTGFSGMDEVHLVMPLKMGQKYRGTEALSQVYLLLKNPADADAFVSKLGAKLNAMELPVRAVRWENHLVGDLYVRTIDWLSIFKWFVLIIVGTVAFLSVNLTVNKIITDRIREIGLLRGVGYTPVSVSAIFLLETGFLAIVGVTVGILVSLFMASISRELGIFYKAGFLTEPVPFGVSLSPMVCIVAGVGIAISVCLTAVFSCRRVMRDSISTMMESR